MAETISRREYARRRGVAESAVRKAIQAGRIRVEADGRIDPDKADQAWDANASRRTRGRSSSTSSVGIPKHTNNDEGEKRKALTLAQAQTAKIVTEAQIASLRLRELQGELVRKKDVALKLSDFVRDYRDQLLSWPARVGAQLAADLDAQGTDARTVIQLLEKYVRDYLTEIARTRRPDL